MRTETAPIVRLEDYRPSDFLIDTVELDVKLHPTETRVTATLTMSPNPSGRSGAPLILDGDELNLKSVSLDGRVLSDEEFEAFLLEFLAELRARVLVPIEYRYGGPAFGEYLTRGACPDAVVP